MPQNAFRSPDLFLDAARVRGGALVPGARPPLATTPLAPRSLFGPGLAVDDAPHGTPATGPTVERFGVEGPVVERPTPPPGTGAERPIKRTYQIRPDQDRALGVALANQVLGQDEAHGEGHSQIIQALLDLHGYNARYLDGEPLR